ncbi:MAG: hypothetical protein AUG51_00100 [Acidobacteria bacterium 13_1_20CM_3_53_8]|nr:MAG: hypothetical protein AUG51_00100 [Acidobacteria bacterium 13_1_20CM_3_53_8]
MKRNSLISVLVLTSLLLVPFPASAKETWNSIRTKNFKLVGNASQGDMRKVAVRLEQFRQTLSVIFPRTRIEASVPTTVVVFKSDDALRPFKPKYKGKTQDLVAAYFTTSADVNYIALSTATEGLNPYEVIFHEYMHFVTGNNLHRAPLWLNEGLAEFYSTFESSDNGQKATLGDPIARHIYYLRERPLLPLKTLLTVNERSPYYNESGKIGVFYAESWALMHYLMLGNGGKRRDQLTHFISQLNSGISLEENFRQSFQADYKTIEDELRGYVTKMLFPVMTLTFRTPFDFSRETESAQLSEAETEYYAGDLLLHIGRLDDAEAHLQKSISLNDHFAPSQISMGILRLRQGKLADARQLFDTAIKVDPQNYLSYYYYALMLNADGQYEEAVKLLKQAAQLNGDSSRVFAEMGYIYLRLKRDDEAITALNRATQLDPFNDSIYRNRSYIYLQLARGLLAASNALIYIRHVGWQDDHSAYMALAAHFGYRQARQTTDADHMLEEAASKLDASAWPYPVIRYLRHELSGEELLALATDNDKLTEAHAYIGLDLSLSGNRERAAEHLRWVRENGNRNFVEYPLALAELSRIEAQTQ